MNFSTLVNTRGAASGRFRYWLACATLAPSGQPRFEYEDHERGQQQGLPTLLTLFELRIFQPNLRQGLGRRLMAFAAGEARRRGLCEIRLYTHEVMSGALGGCYRVELHDRST